MKNLVIIGNGFDLAHGLQTTYTHFIENVKQNPSKYGIPDINNYSNKFFNVLLTGKNKLAGKISLWSDIECLYYEILKNIDNREYLQKEHGNRIHTLGSSKDLNKEFAEIKEWLCNYLSDEEIKFSKSDNYIQFFNQLNGKKTVVLNFNYTKTVKEYISGTDIDLIHIHGELGKEENPMIFGYAADNEESKKLLKDNDNNHVRNIKKFNYLYTDNEEKLIKHLKSPEFNVYILGHSSGISDKLILSQILNSEGIHKIYVFYHKDRDGYFETMVNIDRIIDDYSKEIDEKKSFGKLVTFPQCYKMPQIERDAEFSKYFQNILSEERPLETKAKIKERQYRSI